MRLLLQLLAISLLLGCAREPEKEVKPESTNPIETKEASVPKKKKAATVYKIILKTKTAPGNMNIPVIENLDESMRALAAFYAAMGGSNCDGGNCDLTTALGLGGQGSDEHKDLINRYFPNDKVAETVIKQDCYLRPSGASTFSDFEYLTISDFGDSVTVDYSLIYFNQGGGDVTKGPDSYSFDGNVFKMTKRNLWTHCDK
jgi:hypothetical protein